MIKANELRIGNVFKIQTSSFGFHKIRINGFTETGIINPSVNKNGGKADCTIENLQPIPLTPEVLEKCGFEEWEDGEDMYFIDISADKFETIELHISLKGGVDHKWLNIKSSIESLHQLQNFYFALTGEELEIKLNVESVNG